MRFEGLGLKAGSRCGCRNHAQYYLWGGDTCMALIWASMAASLLLPLCGTERRGDCP